MSAFGFLINMIVSTFAHRMREIQRLPGRREEIATRTSTPDGRIERSLYIRMGSGEHFQLPFLRRSRSDIQVFRMNPARVDAQKCWVQPSPRGIAPS